MRTNGEPEAPWAVVDSSRCSIGRARPANIEGVSMSVPQLFVIQPDQSPDSPAARAHRLYAEARAAAMEQVRAVEQSLARVIVLAEEISEGGDVYPAGVRDLCRRLGDDLTARTNTLESLAQRNLGS
jgi:hypothetical protein